MACVNYYEHHLGDYAAATAHLTLVEDALFSRMLRRYYLQEAPLPVEVAQVARLCGARSPDEVASTEAVLKEFFTLEADGWHNKRADEEIARYHDKQAKAKASADARWSGRKSGGKPSQSERNADALPTQSEGNAHQSPDTSHHKSERETHASTPAGDAGRALRAAGCSTLNLSNPEFMAALDEGVTPDEFTAAAGEASDRGISPSARFAYAVKVARSNHAKAASPIDQPHSRAGPRSSNGKVMSLLQTLEGMKDGLDQSGISNGLPDAGYARLGRSAGD